MMVATRGKRRKKLPRWCKEAKKKLIDLDMSIDDLSAEIGKTRAYVSTVINGRNYSKNIIEEISDYLDIDADIFFDE